MKKNEELRKTYNKIAKDWNNDHSGDSSWWIKGVDKFSSLLLPNSTVLDIGCAGGDKTEYIKKKGLNLEGIDFSEKMIEDARIKYPDIDFKVYDVYDLDNLDKTYDGIFCQAVLLHIPKKDVLIILEKMARRLNHNGYIYIATREIKENEVEEEIKKENDYGYEYERFFSYYSLDELKKSFRDINMKIVYEDIVNSGRSNWIILIVRK